MEFALRPRRSCLAALVISLAWAASLAGQVIVSAPVTITHRVDIQPVRVRKSNGTAAVTFGSSSQETYIKEQINRVWAQHGVAIAWLPFTEYMSDFAYDGTPANYTSNTRPSSHLNQIVSAAGAPPKSANAIVINLFFVEICPGFNQVSDNTANGLAFIDSNGITMHVGANLLGFQGGRDVIASVAAHEIGHNLGLEHTPNGTDNLMSPGGFEERLTASQKTVIFTNRSGVDSFEFLQEIARGSNYLQWADNAGLEGGPGDDDDEDSIANIIEFMLGLDPNASSKLPAPVSAANGLTWTLPKNADALADGLVYQVESGGNLATWLAAGAGGSGSTVVQNNSTALVVRLNSGGGRSFMRMRAEIPAGLAPAAASFIAPESGPGARIISDCGHSGCGVRTAVP